MSVKNTMKKVLHQLKEVNANEYRDSSLPLAIQQVEQFLLNLKIEKQKKRAKNF